jgi:raffinose/stachyose/melibiose transport system substrate-binding protein
MKLGTRRRSLLALGATAPLVAAASACGNEPGGGADGATAWGLTGGAETAMRASFEAWNEANPDDRITAEYFANDAYKEKIRTAVGSGNAPTLIFGWAGATLVEYVENDQVVDLTDDAAALTDRLLPSVAATGMVDDRVYAVPNNQSQPIVLYSNNQVLESAGVQQPPTTWEEFLAAIEALKGADVIPVALAGQSIWPELMWLQYLADRVGGPDAFQRVLDAQEGAWSHPDMLRALGMITELVEVGAFGDSFASVVADAGADQALMYTGKAGMILQGSWIYPDIVTDAPDLVASGGLGYANFPSVPDGAGDPANIVGNPANYWSVSAGDPEAARQAATDYLAAAIYDDEHIESLLSIGAVPPVSGLEDRIAEQEGPEFLQFTYGMVRDAPNFQLSWDQALPASQAQEMLNNLSRLFLGEISPEAFASAMDDTL